MAGVRGHRRARRAAGRLLAGVHGCEYSSIAALVRFMRELDVSALTGTILAVPVASPTSFAARSPFVVPEDGLNLNRSFPGDPDGSLTQVLAHHVFSEFVAGSDLLIDLHGGDMVEALEPFALYDDSPVRDTAERLARAYGLSYVVCDTTDALGGTTSAAAAAAGIPRSPPRREAVGCWSRPRCNATYTVCATHCAPPGCRTASPSPPPPASSWCGAFWGCAPRSAAGGSRR